MSDIFDHELDAWESYENGYNDEMVGGFGCNYSPPKKKDPLYYHTKHTYLAIVAKTKKAYQFEFDTGVVKWVAKSICRDLDTENKTVYIWYKVAINCS